ncbi:hypothetical protein [Phenylobacterium sp.]|uniref:hypothetical protein n=1 Tax=Phenylobacterium sp. TaxID=1871053 RepID=UPI0027354222|nr:hypothetical protein [Phenylobacterium sp.]MDP3175489.1 hypothetical protein [Phenylobacterium sp.]MDP3658733.1 hypothetical protein [Phenylobacterium sp.]
MPELDADDALDPRASFGAAVAVYLRQLYPVDTETLVLGDMIQAGFRGKTAQGVAQILSGVVDARALDELVGTYRMAVVVGAAELLLGESVEDFVARRATSPRDRDAAVGFDMLREALAQASGRAEP